MNLIEMIYISFVFSGLLFMPFFVFYWLFVVRKIYIEMTEKRYLCSSGALTNFITNRRLILELLSNDEYEKLKDNNINDHFCKLKEIKRVAIYVYCFSFVVVFLILYFIGG